MSKQMLELAKGLREAAHYCTELSELEKHCNDIAGKLDSMARQCSAVSAQDVSGLVQDLPLIWQGWCNAIRLMEDKATVRRPENAAQAAAYEQCAKDLKEALARPERTEPQASVMRSAAARWLDKPEVKAALHRRPSGTEPQAVPTREEIARIIDPSTFAMSDHYFRKGIVNIVKADNDKALAKADAILAAFGRSQAESEQ